MVLVDMEMPDSCKDCKLFTSDLECALSGLDMSQYALLNSHPPFCPLKAKVCEATNGDVIRSLFPEFEEKIYDRGDDKLVVFRSAVAGVKIKCNSEQWCKSPWKLHDNDLCFERAHGNGQASCLKCESKGVWNRNWVDMMYKIKGQSGLYCSSCVEELKRDWEELGWKISISENPQNQIH